MREACGAVELVGPPAMLREVLRAALLDAADGVVEVVGRYEAGMEELPAVRLAVEAVPALFEVFAGSEGDQPAACGSTDEIVRELTDGPEELRDRDGIENAIRDLVGAGLLHRHGPFVFATHAAVRLNELKT